MREKGNGTASLKSLRQRRKEGTIKGKKRKEKEKKKRKRRKHDLY